MPICEADPWRLQYFETVACPDSVLIPTEDADAWAWYPQHRWVYDKLAVALSQGLAAAPHGVIPPAFPVFSKPVYNLRGMGTGSQVLASAEAYRAAIAPGHFWMTLLQGEHVSSDAALIDGEAVWWRHSSGVPGPGGTFDHWTIHAAARPALEAACAAWARRSLRGYSGMLNVETIGGRIIEAHLRFADQWPDLYGPGWVAAVVRLYADGIWEFAEPDRRDGYSVVLFAPHGRRYRHPPPEVIGALRARAGVSSVQITFHDDWEAAWHAMPPGGFRLAIVNCHDLEAGLAARTGLERWFEQAGEPVPGEALSAGRSPPGGSAVRVPPRP